jgi:FkbM family methyltransferase
LIRAIEPTLGARLAWRYRERKGDLDIRVIQAMVKAGDTVLDIGANWGLYTWRLADLVGPSGRVYAFEPDPLSGRSLQRIAACRAHVTVQAVALSNRTGDGGLRVPHYRGQRLSALASMEDRRNRDSVEYEVVSVPTARLDSLLPTTSRVTFVKCDVEGHELAVLEGAEQMLKHFLPAILVEIEQRHTQHGSVADTFDYLKDLGYAGYALFSSGVQPLEDFDLQRDQLKFVAEDFVPYDMPAAYVHDFLFVRPGTRLDGSLMSPPC